MASGQRIGVQATSEAWKMQEEGDTAIEALCELDGYAKAREYCIMHKQEVGSAKGYADADATCAEGDERFEELHELSGNAF